MTPDQMDLIIHALSGSVHAFAWVVGLATTVLVTVLGGSVLLIQRAWAVRITALETRVEDNNVAVTNVTTQVKDAATHCSEMRAECRQNLFKTFAPANGLNRIDEEHKTLIERAINAMQVDLLENRNMGMKALANLNKRLGKFEDNFWEAFHKHKHTDKGEVIRG
jgi:hypothetical protein